ncbi:aminoglycoside phosphotransferase family protein [Rhodococcus phenolicus]|uniref:aminoglycoside phosphotransferase family protein n=1 Tax=Rhodococcus phenolicus TaxID=263849 RepID=UPI000830A1DD|nr:aminoglycoside phosphotransferase family protein [Rhodococcus phenolicus]
MRTVIPVGVQAMAERGAQWAAWVDGLPRLVSQIVGEWRLTPDGEATHGHCSLVLPVRDTSGRPTVLKLGFPDDESAHEHLALQHWHGDGAAQLVRADPARRALLLERLGTDDLTGLWDVEACGIAGGLMLTLHRPAVPRLRRLSAYVGREADILGRLPRDSPIPHRLVEQATTLVHALTADEGSSSVILHGDLHYGNVLAGERWPWLAIDPKPLAGDRNFEPAPLLWNRWDELAGDVRGGLLRRFDAVVDAGGLDEDRARGWVVVRAVINARWTLDGARGALNPEQRDRVTRFVTIAKAVQR